MKRHELVKKMMDGVDFLEMFTRYVKIDTQADPESKTFPSSEKEKDLGRQLVKELTELGLADVEMDEYGYVYAHLAGNNGSDKKVAFLAHMDVATDCAGNGVKPQVHENYDGSAIILKENIVIDPKDSPELLECKGDTIITSDGTTLLGADDKAGITAIMAMLHWFKKNPDLKHPHISICFTPDEEIGKGVDFINLEKVNADFAYTIDGGFPNEINYENFDAFSATVTFTGVSIHPGYAKDRMVNAMRYAGAFCDRLPKNMAPETTENREPFIHPLDIRGNAENVTVAMILRSFDIKDIEMEKDIINTLVDELRAKNDKLKIEVKFEESYRNMHTVLKDAYYIVNYVEEAFKELGTAAELHPIRGGTDGARLSFMGLPCPNIFAGGVNFHSQREWVALENIALASALLIKVNEKII